MLSSQTGRSANTYILLHNEIEENYVFVNLRYWIRLMTIVGKVEDGLRFLLLLVKSMSYCNSKVV